MPTVDPILQWLMSMQQNTGGNYGTGVDPALLQMLLPNLGGASVKGATNYMNLLDKQGNFMGDQLKMAMSPEFALMMGSYLPQDMNVEKQVPTPTLNAWMSGSDGPIFQQIAQGMQNGTVSQGTAYAMLKQAQQDNTNPSAQALGLFDDNALQGMVKNAYDEVVNSQTVAAQSRANDPMVKAGLPSASERYTDDLNGDGVPDNVPMGEAGMARYAKERQYYADQQRIAEGRFAGQDVNPSFKGWNTQGVQPGAPGDKGGAATVEAAQAKQGDRPSNAPQSANLDKEQMDAYLQGLPATQRAGLDPIPVGIDEETYQSWKHGLPSTVQAYYPDHYPTAKGNNSTYSVEAKPEAKPPSRVGTDRSFDPSRPVAEVEKWKLAQTNLDNLMMHAKRARAAQLDAQGNTPLKDNLTQRMAMLKIMFGGGGFG